METFKCDNCGERIPLPEKLDDGSYAPITACPECGFTGNTGIDEDDVAAAERIHNAVLGGPKGRIVVHLDSIKEIAKLKEFIPELADIPNSELARQIKAAGMKWESEAELLFIIESAPENAAMYGLRAEIITS